MAATITADTLHGLRALLQRIGIAVAPTESLALLASLDHVDTALDSERLAEVVKWAREQARPPRAGKPSARMLAKLARIVELSDDVLLALAEAKLPAGALRVLGRECSLCDVEQSDEVAAICTSPGCPRRADFDAGVRVRQPVNGCRLEWPNVKARADMREAADHIAAAANDRPELTREQVEALPSHDRVVLGQILATLRDEPLTREPLEGPAVDVLVELDALVERLDNARKHWRKAVDELETWKAQAARAHAEVLLREGWLMTVGKHLGLGPKFSYQDVLDATLAAASAPRYSPPESHPLRLYQWGAWLGALLCALRVEVDAGFRVDTTGREVWLEAALERIEALDVAGLRGLVEAAMESDKCPLSSAEHTMLLFACGALDAWPAQSSGWVSAGSVRVPRVRGETVEVGS